MGTRQLLIHLPEALVGQFKRNVSVRQRSKFIQRPLEEALPPDDGGDDDPLSQTVLAVERGTRRRLKWPSGKRHDR